VELARSECYCGGRGGEHQRRKGPGSQQQGGGKEPGNYWKGVEGTGASLLSKKKNSVVPGQKAGTGGGQENRIGSADQKAEIYSACGRGRKGQRACMPGQGGESTPTIIVGKQNTR